MEKEKLDEFQSSRSYTGRGPPSLESPSLSLPTRQLTNTLTDFQSSTASGPHSRPGPLSSLLLPSSASSSPFAVITKRGMTGSAGSAIISSLEPSQTEWNKCSGITPTMFPQPCQVQASTVPPTVAGRSPLLSVPQPCPTMPPSNPCSSRGPSSWHPAASLPRFPSRQLPASGAVLLWSAGVSAIRIGFLPGTSCHLL